MPEANSKQFPSNKFGPYPGQAPAASAKPKLLDHPREPRRSRHSFANHSGSQPAPGRGSQPGRRNLKWNERVKCLILKGLSQ